MDHVSEQPQQYVEMTQVSLPRHALPDCISTHDSRDRTAGLQQSYVFERLCSRQRPTPPSGISASSLEGRDDDDIRRNASQKSIGDEMTVCLLINCRSCGAVTYALGNLQEASERGIS